MRRAIKTTPPVQMSTALLIVPTCTGVSTWAELPFPTVHSIRRDIPYYHREGFEYFYTQYNLEDVGTYGLLYYLAAKLLWDVEAEAEDDSGEPIRYTFVAESDGGERQEVGPQRDNTARIRLSEGTWTVAVTVDDGLSCDDAADDNTCSTITLDATGAMGPSAACWNR